MAPRVSLEMLSRLIDGQLTDAERAEVETQLASCPLSQALKDALEGLMDNVNGAMLADVAAQTDESSDCVDEETLMRAADGKLGAAEQESVETHLAGCNLCLARVLEHLRTAHKMSGRRFPALPDEIAQRDDVRALVNWQPAPTVEEVLATLTIGLGSPETRSATVDAGSLSVRAHAQAESGDRCRLELEIRADLRALPGQAVVVTRKQDHRRIFTGASNNQGLVELPRVPAGHYLLYLPGQPLKIELQIEP